VGQLRTPAAGTHHAPDPLDGLGREHRTLLQRGLFVLTLPASTWPSVPAHLELSAIFAVVAWRSHEVCARRCHASAIHPAASARGDIDLSLRGRRPGEHPRALPERSQRISSASSVTRIRDPRGRSRRPARERRSSPSSGGAIRCCVEVTCRPACQHPRENCITTRWQRTDRGFGDWCSSRDSSARSEDPCSALSSAR
jgi:hypothetical protein